MGRMRKNGFVEVFAGHTSTNIVLEGGSYHVKDYHEAVAAVSVVVAKEEALVKDTSASEDERKQAEPDPIRWTVAADDNAGLRLIEMAVGLLCCTR
jgi:hypothetical protein